MNEVMSRIMEEQRKTFAKAEASNDASCPFTGGLKVRGRLFTGIVVSKDTHRTVKVEWSNRRFNKKYERFMVRRTKVAAHNPDVIGATIGDKVIIAECKPLSKTKKFVIIKNLGHSKDYMIKRESIEDDKAVTKEKAKAPAAKEAKKADAADDSDTAPAEAAEETDEAQEE